MRTGFKQIGFLLLLLCASACASRYAPSPSQEHIEQMNARRAEAARLIDRGIFSEAVEILTDVNARMPDDAWTLGMLAWAQWKTGAAAEAVENFEASLRRDYSDYLTHLRFAEMLFEMDKIGRAITEFELAARYGQNEPLPHYNYGLALYKLGKTKEALIEWQRAYDLDPADPRFTEAMGMGLSGKDDRRALAYFEEADSLGADGAPFHYNFSQILQRLGRKDRAEEEIKRAIQRAPGNPSYRFGLAALYTNTGRYEDALPVWEALVQQSPDETSYRIYLGRTLYELGRFGEAISTLERFAGGAATGEGANTTLGDDQTGNPPVAIDEALGILAMSHRGLGDLARANFFIEKALEASPRSVEHLNNYGVILAERGMISRAKIQWQKVLEIEPENAIARQNLSAFNR